MAGPKKPSVGRRNFLKGTVGGAAALVAASHPTPAPAQQQEDVRSATAAVVTEERDPSVSVEVLTADHPGSDFMVDVIKALGFEYVFANPGSSFRGLHESVVNYGGNQNPEFITCSHEESSVAMAHGYAKIEGKPGWCSLMERSGCSTLRWRCTTLIAIARNGDGDRQYRRRGYAPSRRGVGDSVQDAAVLVRDFTKWDDMPVSLQHFAESAVRAYKISTTPPTMPVLLVADGDLQETPMPAGARPHIPKITLASPPQGDSSAVAEAARLWWRRRIR